MRHYFAFISQPSEHLGFRMQNPDKARLYWRQTLEWEGNGLLRCVRSERSDAGGNFKYKFHIGDLQAHYLSSSGYLSHYFQRFLQLQGFILV